LLHETVTTNAGTVTTALISEIAGYCNDTVVPVTVAGDADSGSPADAANRAAASWRLSQGSAAHADSCHRI